ncbi:hypothetical protein FB451DRAFT_1367099 [Mycena latifolia]|nr:hypothetical protein FB451DRAFT_1367099 [Mycena latifolia]
MMQPTLPIGKCLLRPRRLSFSNQHAEPAWAVLQYGRWILCTNNEPLPPERPACTLDGSPLDSRNPCSHPRLLIQQCLVLALLALALRTRARRLLNPSPVVASPVASPPLAADNRAKDNISADNIRHPELAAFRQSSQRQEAYHSRGTQRRGP